jgi:hypothetical protein
MLLEDDASYAVVLPLVEVTYSDACCLGGKRGLNSVWMLWRMHRELVDMQMYLQQVLALRSLEMPRLLQHFRILPT